MRLIPLNEIFSIKYGNQLDFEKMVPSEDGINFISRSSKNFGIVGKVTVLPIAKPFEAGLITVTLGGSYLLASFIQPNRFYTAQNIKVLTPVEELSYNEKLFYCLCIQANRFRYSSHGREANTSLDTILVPAIQSIPHWVKSVNKRVINDAPLINTPEKFNPRDWTSFLMTDLFHISGTKTTPINKLVEYGPGIYPYVTTQATNNGIAGFYDFFTELGNVLTVDSAVLGYCAYQELNFSASDHVEKLTPKFSMNKYTGLFIKTIINKQQYKYNYGRKASQERLKLSYIRLPSKNGEPDIQYMEAYIKSLPFAASV